MHDFTSLQACNKVPTLKKKVLLRKLFTKFPTALLAINNVTIIGASTFNINNVRWTMYWHNFIVLAIFLPKTFKTGRAYKFDEVMTKAILLLFETRCTTEGA